MRKFIIIIVALLVILIPSGIILANNLLKAPLDAPLELDVPPTATAAAVEVAEVAVEAPPSQPEPQNQKICGNTGKMSILQVAIASPLEAGHLGADSIRLIVVDFDEVTAEIFTLPADLQVTTPNDLAEEVGYMAPLNLIYLAAYESAPGNPDKVLTQKATQVLAQTIFDQFGFLPDKYININGDAFIKLVDTLGGVTITLQEQIDGSAEFYGVYPEGVQTLDGQRTLDFVRILYPNKSGPDYFGRIERQNLVIFALLDAILKPDNWTKADDILKNGRDMVVTDLSVDQARDLACMVELVDGEANLMAATTENDLVYIVEGQMIPDTDAIREIIAEMQAVSE